MTPEEQELRYAIAGRPTEGPWQVRIGHDNHGLTGYQVLTHTHAAVCVAAQDYYAEGHLPDTDEDGYHMPDTYDGDQPRQSERYKLLSERYRWAPARRRLCMATCPLCLPLDRLSDQFCPLLDRFSDHFALHCGIDLCGTAC